MKTTQHEAMRLAYSIEGGWCRELGRETAAELRRLHSQELALQEWLQKTEWVQESCQSSELGMHRADAIKRRIDHLHDLLGKANALARIRAGCLFQVQQAAKDLAQQNLRNSQEIQDLTSLGGRLALELECLLLECEDTAAVSKWWNSAQAALEDWRSHLWSVSHGPAGELTANQMANAKATGKGDE